MPDAKIKKFTNKVATQLSKNLRISFEKYLPELKEVYIDSYDKELGSVVTDRNSLANPIYFYDDYVEALDNFDYFYDNDEEGEEFRIKIPTADTFQFSGRLNFIQMIVHGTAGKYYELSQEDYDVLRKSKDLDDKVKRKIYELPEFFDNSTPKELRFYLVPSTGNLYKTIQGILGKKLILFPFSNSPPVDIFEAGVNYFESVFDSIVTKVVDGSIKLVKRSM